MTVLFISGSLRNSRVPGIAQALRGIGYEVFDDWHAVGPRADEHWQSYEEMRRHSYAQALRGWAARHTYDFDLYNLNRVDGGVLVLPAGRSAHMEFGYIVGQGKKGYVLFDQGPPERWDVMYQFAAGIFFSLEEMLEELDQRQLPLMDDVGIKGMTWNRGLD